MFNRTTANNAHLHQNYKELLEEKTNIKSRYNIIHNY